MLAEPCIKIRDEYCSRCFVCSSVCPFEAISYNRETGSMVLDLEKCRVCGICASACPSSSIDIAYYKLPIFTDYAIKERRKSLVLMCKGALIRPEVREYLIKRGIEPDFAPLRVPCVGRIPPALIIQLLKLDVERVALLFCESNKCRFNFGSNIGILRFLLTQRLLSQLGFDYSALTVVRETVKARVNVYRCIGCGNCAFVCPYNAIKIASPGISQIDEGACKGCGACAAVCPALAINMEGFEHDFMLRAIREHYAMIKEVKAKTGKPAVLVLYCQWANFTLPEKRQAYFEDNTAFIEIPCSSMLNPLYVLHAFYSGYDGVLVIACKKGECRFEKGNELAERHTNSIKRLLQLVNLDRRFETHFVSPKYIGEVDVQIKSFIDRISSL